MAILAMVTGYNTSLRQTLEESRRHELSAFTNARQAQQQVAKQRLEQYQRTAFATQLQQVARIAVIDPNRGLAILDDAQLCPVQRRDFSWALLWPACQRTVRLFSSHHRPVRAIAISTDGNRIASADDAGIVSLWGFGDHDDGSRWGAFPAAVNTLAFSPAVRQLAVGGQLPEIHIFTVANPDEVLVLRGHSGDVNSLQFSNEGPSLISASSDQMIRIWDTGEGVERSKLEGHTASVFSIRLAPDGETLLSGGKDATTCLWDLNTGRLMRRWSDHRG